MTARSLVWLGVRTPQFAAMAAFYRMVAAGIEFIGDVQHDGTATWNHFRAPDGNVYELISRG